MACSRQALYVGCCTASPHSAENTLAPHQPTLSLPEHPTPPLLAATPRHLQERARAAEGHTGPVLVVMRPHPTATGTPVNTANSTHTAGADSAAATAAGPAGGDGHQLVPVPLPVGSVRASLGALSTFEDCYALVRFLGTTFRDFHVSSLDLMAGVKTVGGTDTGSTGSTVLLAKYCLLWICTVTV